MRKFIIILTSFILITGCLDDSKKEILINSSVKRDFISQRHLHEKTFEDFNFKTEQDWDNLNSISQEKYFLKKEK